MGRGAAEMLPNAWADMTCAAETVEPLQSADVGGPDVPPSLSVNRILWPRILGPTPSGMVCFSLLPCINNPQIQFLESRPMSPKIEFVGELGPHKIMRKESIFEPKDKHRGRDVKGDKQPDSPGEA